MRKIGLFFLVLTIMFSGCGTTKKHPREQTISVSIWPQKYFIDRISQHTLDVNVMIPAGASPATYEPVPDQMKQLSGSSYYFSIQNIGFEKAWAGRFKELFPHITWINTAENIGFLTEKHDGHQEKDPHVWVSLKSGKQIAQNIYHALCRIYPERDKEFSTNYAALINEIDSLDQANKKAFRAVKTRSFIIFHPALTYFANDYQLRQISLEIHGKEPTAKHMKELVDLAQQENITLILIQKEFDVENAQLLKEEIGGEIYQIDPLAYDWLENMKIISSLLLEKLN